MALSLRDAREIVLAEGMAMVSTRALNGFLRDLRDASKRFSQIGSYTRQDISRYKRVVDGLLLTFAHEFPLLPVPILWLERQNGNSVPEAEALRVLADHFRKEGATDSASAPKLAFQVLQSVRMLRDTSTWSDYVDGDHDSLGVRELQSAQRDHSEATLAFINQMRRALERIGKGWREENDDDPNTVRVITTVRSAYAGGVKVVNLVGLSDFSETYETALNAIETASEMLKRRGFGFLVRTLTSIDLVPEEKTHPAWNAMYKWTNRSISLVVGRELLVASRTIIELVHEWGHHYWYTELPVAAQRRYKLEFTNAKEWPSQYAKTKVEEDFAEAFTAFAARGHYRFPVQYRLTPEIMTRFRTALILDKRVRLSAD